MDFGKKPEKGNGFWSGVFGNQKIWDVYNKNEVKLVIYDCKHPEEMKELSTGLSNALGFVAFGEKVYWNVNDPKPKWTYSDEIRPPTKEGEPYEGYSILGNKFLGRLNREGYLTWVM
jgi:hypothetical protein